MKLCNRNYAHIENIHVSGRPTRVCKCNMMNYPECHDQSYTQISENIHPGEVLPISVAIVGGDWGITTGILYAKFAHFYYDRSGSSLIPQSQYAQEIYRTQCSKLLYNVYGYNSAELILSVEQSLALTHYPYCNDDNSTVITRVVYYAHRQEYRLQP